MPRFLAAILLVAVLAIGGGLIATTAYQAGLGTAVTTAAGSGATVVAPVVVPAYGYGFGWHAGFGIFGLFFTILFVFIVFGLLRAVFFRGTGGGRGWGGPGWGPGGYGPGRDGSRPGWESRAHDTFETWHRQAHDGGPTTAGTGTPPAPPISNPPA